MPYSHLLAIINVTLGLIGGYVTIYNTLLAWKYHEDRLVAVVYGIKGFACILVAVFYILLLILPEGVFINAVMGYLRPVLTILLGVTLASGLLRTPRLMARRKGKYKEASYGRKIKSS